MADFQTVPTVATSLNCDVKFNKSYFKESS